MRLPFASLYALTLQVVGLLLAELKTRIRPGLSLLPPGAAVVNPPPMRLLPAGQTAVTVPVACFASVKGVPETCCTPERPGAPCGPCGPCGPCAPAGPCGPATPCG